MRNSWSEFPPWKITDFHTSNDVSLLSWNAETLTPDTRTLKRIQPLISHLFRRSIYAKRHRYNQTLNISYAESLAFYVIDCRTFAPLYFSRIDAVSLLLLSLFFFGHRRVQRSRVNNRFLYGHGIINPSMYFHACWPFTQLCWLTIHFLKHLNESTPFYCCIRLLISVEFETFPDAFHGYELFCHSFSIRNYFNYLIDSNKKLTSCSFFKLLEIVLL